MEFCSDLNLSIPVIYVNPPINADPKLIEEVFRAGGLGVIDCATSGHPKWEHSPQTPHGLRVHLDEIQSEAHSPSVRMLLTPFEEADTFQSLKSGILRKVSTPVFAEVGNIDQAREAERIGAAGLIARGNEGPGWVSEMSGFVLLQQLLGKSSLPVFLQGGVGLRTAAGAWAAGVAGIVLDYHLLFAKESGLSESLKSFLASLRSPVTIALAESTPKPLRVYARMATKIVRELRHQEDSASREAFVEYLERLHACLEEPPVHPDTDNKLLPLSEDLLIAKDLADRYTAAGAIVEAFGQQMNEVKFQWPFAQDSRFCVEHKTVYPIFQGPMAHVSDNVDFLRAVQQSGALPFLAMGNMPASIAAEALERARAMTAGNFGVGLIGLEANRQCYEIHLDLMRKTPPPYAILAGGSVALAKKVQEVGTKCYLHCPSPGILAEALKSGLRRFVFEGSESGGHIGPFGSLTLWNANLRELETRIRGGINPSEVYVLFAGGVGTGRGAAFIAGMVSDMVGHGLNVGIQMGTGYLATKEAVSTGAITETYQKLVFDSCITVVIGRTVNTRARAANSAIAARLTDLEQSRLKDGIPLRERKELYEKDNLGALRLATKGCEIDLSTATSQCPVFCEVPPEEQIQRGLYLMGQVACVIDEPRSMRDLHTEIIENAHAYFQSRFSVTPQLSSEDQTVLETPAASSGASREPIAIIGIGLRFPGSDSPESFWDQIMTGRSGICAPPKERWDNPELYYDPDPKAPDKTYCLIGGFIKDFKFDAVKFKIPPSVAQKMDRTQQFAIACVEDALANAGIHGEDLHAEKVGIIIGASLMAEATELYAERVKLPNTIARLEKCLSEVNVESETRRSLIEKFRSQSLSELPEVTEDSLPGELANIVSGRIASVFNLTGPNFTVDAACASTLAAVMNATAALRDGTIDLAIAGGSDGCLQPSGFVKFCKLGALSPDGSRPFDKFANGFVMGEGAGILILKRLPDAVRDGDKIYATILDLGSASDGRGKGITAPNPLGQERALHSCYQAAGIDPGSVGLIEAHGTGTPVGDKIELLALHRFFAEAGAQRHSVGIGSVKSQIGHLKPAAGAAGLIKAILSLHHRILPPTINVKVPNPCIDWDSSPLFLLTEPTPWTPKGNSPRRAGVSAFGFGGTNFHALLQEHVPESPLVITQDQAPQSYVRPGLGWPAPSGMEILGEPWVICAHSTEELTSKIKEILTSLDMEAVYQLTRRNLAQASRFPIRCGFAAKNPEEARKKLELALPSLSDPSKRGLLRLTGIHIAEKGIQRSAKGIVFLFPGQGSQYPFMLRDMVERFPSVAKTFQEADEVLGQLGLTTPTSLLFSDEWNSASEPTALIQLLKDTSYLQPILLTADVALLRAFQQIGVYPAACAGHSLGEFAACVAAGIFSFRDALEIVAVRGREMANVSAVDPGAMMSVLSDTLVLNDVLSQIPGYVVTSGKNAPRHKVISGETEAIRKAEERFKERDVRAMPLPVSGAFHSQIVAPAKKSLLEILHKCTTNIPKIPVVSNVTADFFPMGSDAPEQIRHLLGEQLGAPVEWVKTLQRLYADGFRLFVECGPKQVLTNFSRETLPDDILALPSDHARKSGVVQFMEVLAALAVEGVPVTFETGPRGEYPQKKKTRPPIYEIRAEDRKPAPPARQEPETGQPVQPHRPELFDGELLEHEAFEGFAKSQGALVRGLIKSTFQNYLDTILPMERVAKRGQSPVVAVEPVCISGTAAGLPSDTRFPFDRESLDDLLKGKNFIKPVAMDMQRTMVEKNVQRIVKSPDGNAEFRFVDSVQDVVRLAGSFVDSDFHDEYGLSEKLSRSMDITTQLAVAAGIEALKDAGIPLVQMSRTTSTGKTLHHSWALPPALRQGTGVIFASAFPGMASVIEEVTKQLSHQYGTEAKRRIKEVFSLLLDRVESTHPEPWLSEVLTHEMERLEREPEAAPYTFDRSFLLRAVSMAHGYMAQALRAQGPNTHINAACAATTQAILIARDWIRTGQADRVIVIAADDAAGDILLPWLGSAFVAIGAATTAADIENAALPFDVRRHGLIIGSAAVGLVIERADLVKQRGMEPVAMIEDGIVANSGYHLTNLEVDHISSVMKDLIKRWEAQSGLSRDYLADNAFFMSHETYTPKRGGSADAEIRALRDTFGKKATSIPIANTKGFTGHTMAVGVEDVTALRCLQLGMLPPIPNLREIDPEFADMNLSKGGRITKDYALRLAAGFGSQIVMAIYKVASRASDRTKRPDVYQQWLREVTGYANPLVKVQDRALRVVERPQDELPSVQHPRSDDLVRISESGSIPAAEAGRRKEIERKIISLLSEKTGYPVEILDTNLDLEADLGIDTVKQAEFISEIRESAGIPAEDGLKITDFPTAKHIIDFVYERTRTDHGLEEQLPLAGDIDRIRSTILRLLSEKTGYPMDVLAPDLDLEADLGIDTVKQAEFISEVREIFNISLDEGLKITDFPTANHIVGYVLENRGDTEVESHLGTQREDPFSQEATPPEIGLFESRLIPLPSLKPRTIPHVEEIIVIGGTKAFNIELDRAFRSMGYPPIRTMEDSSSLKSLSGKRVGIVNLLGMSNAEEAVANTFELYLACSRNIEQGVGFLVAVVQEDGALGLETPSPFGHIIGCVAGATKAFSREFPDVPTRIIDLHPNLSAIQCGEYVAQSLREEFPLEVGIGSDGLLRVVRFVPLAVETTAPAINPGELALVTGGARGITAECLVFLAEKYQPKFAILGRTRLSEKAEHFADYQLQQWEEEKRSIIERMRREDLTPTPVMVEQELSRLKAEAEVFGNLARLRSLGCYVAYHSVDICNFQAVNEAIEETNREVGPVDVVIHAAGIDSSRALRSKSLAEMKGIVDVKVKGMQNLLDAFKNNKISPRRIVGFGSVSGRTGTIGQVDYSAANDGLAHMLRAVDTDLEAKVSIIDWGPWAEKGMAVRETVRKALAAEGLDFIPPRKGAELLDKELMRMSGPCEVLAAGELGELARDTFFLADAADSTERVFAGQSGEIIHFLPGNYLKAKVVLNPGHPLLDDHRVGGAAVLAGVAGLEIMRTAANILASGQHLSCVKDLRFLSPLKLFTQSPFDAVVEIIRVNTGAGDCSTSTYDARILSQAVDKKGRRFGPLRLHHCCVLLMAVENDSLFEISTHKSSGNCVWTSRTNIYKTFFHGPAFQFLDRVITEDGLEQVAFSYRDTNLRETMFSDSVSPGIEAMFQAAASLALESHRVMTLPVAVKQVNISSSPCLQCSGGVSCDTESSLKAGEGKGKFRFDGVLRDSAGQAIMTVQGIEMIELDHMEPFEGTVAEHTVLLDSVDEELRSKGDVFLAEVLCADEMNEWTSKRVAKRALEWLGGRIAIKASVRRMFLHSGMEPPALNEIRVVVDEHRRPSAELAAKPGIAVADVSVSHSNGVAVAVASSPGWYAGLGVDVEIPEARSERWVSDYFTEAEKFLAGETEDRWLRLTEMWCVKEAVLKAFGKGLNCDLRDLCITRVGPEGRAHVDLAGELCESMKQANVRRPEVFVSTSGGWVTARAVLHSQDR